MAQKLKSGFKDLRDLLLFLLGGSGIIHELLGEGERPFILALCAGLVTGAVFTFTGREASIGGHKKEER